MKLYVQALFTENAAAKHWNGLGQFPQQWVYGGIEHYYYHLNVSEDIDGVLEEYIDDVLEAIKPKVEWSSNYTEQYIIDYCVVADHFLTDYEQQQLRTHNRIINPVITLNEA